METKFGIVPLGPTSIQEQLFPFIPRQPPVSLSRKDRLAPPGAGEVLVNGIERSLGILFPALSYSWVIISLPAPSESASPLC